MPEQHRAQVKGTTPWGETFTTWGFSGNQAGFRYRIFRLSRQQRANAAIFFNFLERLNDRNYRYGGGKTAFTCAEPQGILTALIRGSRFRDIRILSIRCGAEDRNPCGAFCGTYIDWDENEQRYRLDMTQFPDR